MSDASSPDRDAALLGLAERLGHDFGDRFGSNSLLELALRHRSWCAEHGGVGSNERLEFLGDSVLGVVVTEYLYTTMPDAPEGVLARCRSEIVNWRSLAEVARDLEIGPVLRLGRGEIATEVPRSPRSWPTRSKPWWAQSSSTPASTSPAESCSERWTRICNVWPRGT